ncbi:hypothetical protein K456DRAFT_1191316 [Colletotrichum gloeosporioides 23]|nr:hypothetical protein K456DRAFT_1191316 [Colletotrichum gloeosporioides 23]
MNCIRTPVLLPPKGEGRKKKGPTAAQKGTPFSPGACVEGSPLQPARCPPSYPDPGFVCVEQVDKISNRMRAHSCVPMWLSELNAAAG